MLDIRFIRDNPDLIKAAATKKHLKFNLDDLLAAETNRVELLREVENLRQEQNKVGEQVVVASGDTRDKLINGLKNLKDRLQVKEADLAAVMKTWQRLMLEVPNMPDISVPEGKTDAENKEIKTWGEKPLFAFTPKDHLELLTNLGLVDFERGAKVHGFRGYFLLGDAVKLTFAIWQYALEFFSNKSFVPVLPPAIVRKTNLYGTAHLPGEVEDYYVTQDDDVLAGTAEVPLMGYHAGEVLELARLPIKYLGFSPCYRREAGSHGKDVKGLIRVHEFYKFEQVILGPASHERSVQLHEELQSNTEAFIESLGLPYRTVVNCGGDLGLGQVKKYDIELWVPQENTYREISSASYFHDFQCRRFNIRYRNREGKLEYAHSLNATAIPTPRILVALAEHYQQADGSIMIPEVLRPYSGLEIIKQS